MASGPHTSRDSGLACKDCPDAPSEGHSRCKPCRLRRNEREREQRAERKRRKICWVAGCGKRAVKDAEGQQLTSCEAHRGTAWRTG